MRQDKTRHAVKAIIWRQATPAREFLLLKLNSTEAAAKSGGVEWHPAGGVKDDPTESDRVALLREVAEEAGISATELIINDEALVQRQWTAPYNEAEGYHYVATFYACQYIGEDRAFTLSHEHDDIGWFTPERLPSGTTVEVSEAIAVLQERLTTNRDYKARLHLSDIEA